MVDDPETFAKEMGRKLKRALWQTLLVLFLFFLFFLTTAKRYHTGL